MASYKLMTTKDGRKYYKIYVSRGHGKTPFTKNWYVPENKSQKFVEEELKKASYEFERKCEEGEIKTRAEKKEEERLRKLEEGKIKTLKQYGEEVFMPAKAAYYSEKSRADFQSKLNLHIYPTLGDYKLEEITPAQIKALITKLQGILGNASVVKIYEIINLLFRMAYLDDTIEKNPMDKVDRPRAKKSERKDSTAKAFTEKELEHILECAENEPLKWKTYLYLLIDTGCRRGEISGLKWRSVDFKKNAITIENNLCYTAEKGVYDDTPKNGKTRVIYVDPVIMSMLKELKAEQLEVNNVIPIDDTEKADYVFTQVDGLHPMHPTSVTHYLRKFGERCEIKDFHAHKFRHTWATIAILKGADIASVSEKLGHSDVAVTLRMYTHANEESQKKASEIFRSAVSFTR